MVKIAIITYSTYGHVTTLAKSVQAGVEKAGGQADLFQIPETLTDDVLALIHAPAKPVDIPIATLETLQEYDAFLFGIPTRFGNFPGQWKAFWDSTGGLWANGALYGKPAGIFVSTGTPGGGQETTVRNVLSTLVHHGIIYVPLGYKNSFGQITNLEEVHGGSAWGAGTFAGGDGSRSPSELELEIASIQGQTFFETVKKFGSKEETSTSVAAPKAVTENETASKTAKAPATRKSQATTSATTTSKSDSKSDSGCGVKCTIM